jgi:AraC-like DNA-binding protein
MVASREPKRFTHHSNAPTWEHTVGQPSPALQHLVRCYSGHYQDLKQSALRLQVPSTQVFFILAFGDDLRIRSVSPNPDSERYQSFVVGLEAQPLLREHHGERYCIAIPLSPWAAYRLFQGAAAEFAQEVVALEDIWGKDADRLIEQLSELSSWAQRFAFVDRLLTDKFITSHYVVRPEVRWAWKQLEAHGGCVPIRQLARSIGWSDRYFAMQFRKQIGITPKLAARQIRFAHAHRLLSMSEGQSLSEIALACGYSDQSHFTREFHAFAGCSPDTFHKAELLDAPDFPGVPGKIVDESVDW